MYADNTDSRSANGTLPPGYERKHTVYSAVTGVCILDSVTEGQFDRWYDGHSDYRAVRSIEEVNPEFRDLYDAINDRPGVHWLRED